MVDPGLRPVDQSVTRIGERRERKPRKPFQEIDSPDDDDRERAPSRDRSSRPTPPGRGRLIDVHVIGAGHRIRLRRVDARTPPESLA